MFYLILHDIRSLHNVGSILRTADGLGVDRVYMTGFTPYPDQGQQDKRLPHVRHRVQNQLHKTALGAETAVPAQPAEIESLISSLRDEGFFIAALEQHPSAININEFQPDSDHLALILGNETSGLDRQILSICDQILEIPMRGSKRSFNVSVAAALGVQILQSSQE